MKSATTLSLATAIFADIAKYCYGDLGQLDASTKEKRHSFPPWGKYSLLNTFDLPCNRAEYLLAFSLGDEPHYVEYSSEQYSFCKSDVFQFIEGCLNCYEWYGPVTKETYSLREKAEASYCGQYPKNIIKGLEVHFPECVKVVDYKEDERAYTAIIRNVSETAISNYFTSTEHDWNSPTVDSVTRTASWYYLPTSSPTTTDVADEGTLATPNTGAGQFARPTYTETSGSASTDATVPTSSEGAAPAVRAVEGLAIALVGLGMLL